MLYDILNGGDKKWYYLSSNPHPKAIKILRENLDKVNWDNLVSNEGAFEIIKDHMDETFNRYALCSNPNPDIVKLVLSSPRTINFKGLSRNTNPDAIKFIREHIRRADDNNLSSNPAAVELIRDKIFSVDYLSLSLNDGDPELLRENIDKLDFCACLLIRLP